MAKQDDYVKTALRLPRALHASLTASAAERGHSLNTEMVARLQRSFEPQVDDSTLSVISRLDFQLAEAEHEVMTSKLQLTEFALAVKMAVSLIPKDVLAAQPELQEHVDEWIADANERLLSPNDLMREAEEKTERFMKAADRYEKISKMLLERAPSWLKTSDAQKEPDGSPQRSS